LSHSSKESQVLTEYIDAAVVVNNMYKWATIQGASKRENHLKVSGGGERDREREREGGREREGSNCNPFMTIANPSIPYPHFATTTLIITSPSNSPLS